jgi:proteasome lid subunit RPN8/RPN11
MLRINKKEYDLILHHAVISLPKEACGLLGGIVEQGAKLVKEVYLLRNVDESEEHFSMDPKEQLLAVKDLRQKGYELFGIFIPILLHPQGPRRRINDLPLIQRRVI